MGILDSITEFFRGLSLYDEVPDKHRPVQPGASKKPPPAVAIAKAKPLAVIDFPRETAAWRGIIWHHSATTDSLVHENWSAIRRYHMVDKGWSNIGYHGGVERVGNALKFQLGRSWTRQGAHSGFVDNQTYNKQYLGLCAIGNFDKAPPDEELWQYCLSVTRAIQEKLDIPYDEVLGHREVYALAGKPKAKDCPGTHWDMEKFRRDL